MNIQIITTGMFLTSVLGVKIPEVYEKSPSTAVGPITFPTATAPEEQFSRQKYTYGYNIQYPITGGSKVQQKAKDGDEIRRYFFGEALGSRRVVNYGTNLMHGFNGAIQRKSAAIKPVISPIRLLPIGIARPTFIISSSAGVPVVVPTHAIAVRPHSQIFAPVRLQFGRPGTPFGFPFSY